MDSLGNILDSKQLAAPDELKTVKDYILRRYKSNCGVKLERGVMIISVPNSALAGTLQLEKQSLIEACALSKYRLVIRIGQ